MSAETHEWLVNNLRIGFTDERGPAWWARGTDEEIMADGSHFPGPVPADEVFRLLDVQLIESPLFAQFELNGEREVVKLDDRKGIVLVRDGKVVAVPGVFKSGYQTHGYNEWINKGMQDIADSPLETAAVGLLRKGGVAFHQVKLPETFEVAGFGFQPYFTGGTSCDGTLASVWFTGVDAAVCDNTFEMARQGASTRLKMKHTKNSPGKLGEIRDRLGLIYKAAEDFGELAENLLAVDVSDEDFRLWLDEMVPMPEPKAPRRGKNGNLITSPGRGFTIAESKRDELKRLWTSDAKVKPWAGTAFGILQLDNTWRTWEGKVSAEGGRFERNLTNQVIGTTADADQAALDALAKVQDRKLVMV